MFNQRRDLKWQSEEKAGGQLIRRKGPPNVRPAAVRSTRSKAAGGSANVKAANENAIIPVRKDGDIALLIAGTSAELKMVHFPIGK